MKFRLIVLTLTIFAFSAIAKETYFVNPKKPSGKLVLNSRNLTKALFPVVLVSIDGNQVSPKENAAWLKPGSYKLTFSSRIDQALAGGNGLNMRKGYGLRDLNNELDLTVEADKTYYISFDAKAKEQEKWRPVVWKQE